MTRPADDWMARLSIVDQIEQVRRQFAELQAARAVDADGHLDRTWRMLHLKRGCRRGHR